MIVGLTGTNASGKGTVASYLAKKGFVHYSLSDELRTLLSRKKIAPTRENLIRWGTHYRKKYGTGYLAQLVKKKIGRNERVVVDSIRNLGEIAQLRTRKDFILLAIDAPIKVRYQRARRRSSERDALTFKEFVAHEQAELHGSGPQQQLLVCMKKADIRIDTHRGYNNLYKKLDALLMQWDKGRK